MAKWACGMGLSVLESDDSGQKEILDCSQDLTTLLFGTAIAFAFFIRHLLACIEPFRHMEMLRHA